MNTASMTESPVIISASRRTDIPALYTEWLGNRLKAGYCTVVNPFSPKQVSRVSLEPGDVSALVFWTKNPAPFLADSELLRILESSYAFYFLFTLTGYPASLEPVLAPRRNALVDSFRRLSSQIGRERVIWRYDPVIISSVTDCAFHYRNFRELSGLLQGWTSRIIISVLDSYRTVEKRFASRARESALQVEGKESLAQNAAFFELLTWMRERAAECGMTIQSCSESIDLGPAGIAPGPCIDPVLIRESRRQVVRTAGEQLYFPGIDAPLEYRKDPGQRGDCLCTVSRDIGAPLSCTHRCLYCYASPGDYEFRRTMRRSRHMEKSLCEPGEQEFHDPTSPSLIGWYEVKKQ